MKMRWPTLVFPSLVTLVCVMRWFFPERTMTEVGLRAIWDAIFAVTLLIIIGILSSAAGWKVLRWFKQGGLSNLEQAVFALPLGWGMIAYGIFLLGMVGWLHLWGIIVWLFITSLWTWREWTSLLEDIPHRLIELRNCWLSLVWGKRLILLISLAILAITFLQALAPPTGYDGLMYHLQGPKLFLGEQRLILLPEIWQANGPFTVEMLYSIGLSFGSDIFSQLVHLAYAVCLVLAMFAFGRRFGGDKVAWVSVAILMGIPLFPYLATLPNVDMPWALYSFLAMFALFLWWEHQDSSLLILAGLFLGLALGSKYLTLGWAAILGLWILWNCRKMGWRQLIVQAGYFGFTAILVASPWYLKNLLLSGNPFYPFFFGGPGWDALRLNLYSEYSYGFGSGRSLVDYLLLPWNIYFRYFRFVSLGIEIPSLLFPLVTFYPLTRRSWAMNILAVLTFFSLMVWALSVQITRYMFPAFPALSLLTAYVLSDLTGRIPWKVLGRILASTLLGSVMIVSLIVLLMIYKDTSPWLVILGLEAKDTYLRRAEGTYAAQQFVRDNLPTQAWVLMLWDGRSYYCDERCLPDSDQSRWTRLSIQTGFDSQAMSALLEDLGITHLFYSRVDKNYVTFHDVSGLHQKAVDFLENEFLPICGKELYHDQKVVIYQLACGG